MSKGKNTVEAVEKLLEPIVAELGLLIWEVSYEKEGTNWYLKVLADKEGGITLDDCEALNRKLGVVLDQTDPIPEAYWLEVSSPGLERPLTRDWHFEWLVGQQIQVKLFRPVDGETLFVGRLIGKTDGVINLALLDNTEIHIQEKETTWVRKYMEF